MENEEMEKKEQITETSNEKKEENKTENTLNTPPRETIDITKIIKYNKNTKKLIKILVVIGIIVAIGAVFVYPYIVFKLEEKKVTEAAEKYLKINSSMLPQEGSIRTIPAQTLVDKKYITDLRTAYDRDTCNVKNSFVKVKRTEGEYIYYTYLECGYYKSSIDHKGPVITLNDKDVINVERGESFTDPGIKKIKDNTDGQIDTTKAIIKGEVDTSKIGTYEITYSITDSLENKTTVTRTVIVSQSLTKAVEKAVGSSKVYQGNDDNMKNYIKFSGQLFRIVGLDNNGNVKIVSDEDISQVDFNSLEDWLNNYYYEHIDNNSKKYLVKNEEICNDTIKKENIEKMTECSKKEKANVTVLSVEDYNKSLKDDTSYLYPSTINWTSNSMSDKKAWTTRSYFYSTDINYLEYAKNMHYNVRPVLILKNDIKVKSGSGTVDNPYNIGDFKKVKAGSPVTKARSGEYVSYKNTVYRIIESNVDGYAKVISSKAISLNEENYTIPNIYNPEKSGTVAYYIENNTSKLVNTSIFTKHKIEVPIYTKKSSYKGKKEIKNYKVKFAAPNLYEMYSSYDDYTFYINSSKDKDIVYTSSANGVILTDKSYIPSSLVSTVTGYLKKDVVIIGGSGTEQSPYQLNH